jgi:hypothetical protein
MALTNPYCQVADVRSQLGDSASTLDTSLIEKAIAATSRAIDRYCNRRFWQDPAPVTRLYTALDPCVVDVDDISTAAGMIVKVDTGGDGTYATTWATTDYQLRPLNADADGGAFSWRQIAALGGKTFPCCRYGGHPALQVTAQWGWSAIPDDVVEAAVLKSVSLFMRKDAPFGVAGFGDFGPVRITKRDPDVTDLLSPFQITAVA